MSLDSSQEIPENGKGAKSVLSLRYYPYELGWMFP